jgi:hypothetical protein
MTSIQAIKACENAAVTNSSLTRQVLYYPPSPSPPPTHPLHRSIATLHPTTSRQNAVCFHPHENTVAANVAARGNIFQAQVHARVVQTRRLVATQHISKYCMHAATVSYMLLSTVIHSLVSHVDATDGHAGLQPRIFFTNTRKRPGTSPKTLHALRPDSDNCN